MSLTPEQIANREFAVGLRGYDQNEVREFLRTVAMLVAAGDPGLSPIPEGVSATSGGGDPAGSGGARPSTDGGTVRGDDPTEVDAQVAALIRKAEDEAEEIRQSAAAEAEMARARARTILAVAQQEALGLIAEAHARIERRGGGTSPSEATGSASGSTIEQLGQEISAMVRARDDVLDQLHRLQRHVDEAVRVAEADPVVGRTSAITGA